MGLALNAACILITFALPAYVPSTERRIHWPDY